MPEQLALDFSPRPNVPAGFRACPCGLITDAITPLKGSHAGVPMRPDSALALAILSVLKRGESQREAKRDSASCGADVGDDSNAKRGAL